MKKLTLLALVAFFTLGSAFAADYDNLYVVGDACDAGWDAGKSLPMEKQDGQNIFTWEGKLLDKTGDNGKRGFKFLTQKAWEGSISVGDPESEYVTITSGQEEALRVVSGGKDNRFQVPETATYRIVVNTDAMTMTCTKTGDAEETADLNQLYMVGDALNGYEHEGFVEMPKHSAGIFVWKGELKAGTFKFQNKANSWAENINPADDVTFEAGEGYALTYKSADKKFTVAEAGEYVILVNLKEMTFKAENAALGTIEELFIIGSALNENGTWVYVNTPMEKIGDNQFSWTGNLYTGAEGAATEFKFRTNDTWDKTVCSAVANTEIEIDNDYSLYYRPFNYMSDDSNFKVTTAGKYIIKVNVTEMKMTVEKGIEGGGSGCDEANALSASVIVLDKAVKVLVNDSEAVTAAIFDVTGKCINVASGIESSMIIADNLTNGIYIVKLSANDKESVQKVMIK